MTFSGTRFSGWYLVAQALAILGWWIYLTLIPAAAASFLPQGASRLELIAFRLPDLIVAAPASLAAGVAILAGLRSAVPLAWTAAGAMTYAFVYCVAWSILRGGGWLNVVLMAPAALLSTVSALDASASIIVIFRRASRASAMSNVLKTLVQIAAFWSFFLLVVPAALVYVQRQLQWPAFTFPAHRGTAASLFMVLSILGLASGVTIAFRGVGTPLPFASPNRLVTSGPYAYVRNPMVIAGLGQGAAVGLWLGSWLVLGYVLLGALIWNYLVRPAEERDLLDRFGEDFVIYSKSVSCWRPRLRPFVPRAD